MKIQINKIDKEDSKSLLELYTSLDIYFCPYYPDFEQWYTKKVCNELKTEERNIYVAKHGNKFQALAITKHSGSRNCKICTFFVFPAYRKNGIGSALMSLSLENLKKNNPKKPVIITVPGERLNESIGDVSFSKLLNKYNFKLTQIAKNRYRSGHDEYIFKH